MDLSLSDVQQQIRDMTQDFAAKEIRPGEPFSAGNLAVLRRGKLPQGLEPRCFEEIMGRRARRSIPQGSAIQREDYD